MCRKQSESEMGNKGKKRTGVHKKSLSETQIRRGLGWSGRPDLNWRPLRPERSALAKLSHAPLALDSKIISQHRREVNVMCNAPQT